MLTDAHTSSSTGPLGRGWRRWIRLWREDMVADRESFRRFATANAAFIAQKCAIDYCRGKTGAFSYSLFAEQAFVDALTVCRWETYAATLGDILVLSEGILYPALRDTAEAALLKRRLIELHAQALMAEERPGEPARGWDDVCAAFAARLGCSDPATLPGPAEIARHSAQRLFETLPIHTSMRRFDEEIVTGAVRFHMVALHARMVRTFDRRRILDALLAAT